MHERRKLTRWCTERQAKVKLAGAEAFAECTVSDINLKGAKICLKITLPKDTLVKFCLQLGEDFSIEAEAWIVWHRIINGHNMYGLYFTKLRDLDREKIYQFVYRHSPQEIHKQWWRDLPEKKGGGAMQDRRVFERFKVQLPMRFLDSSRNQEGQANTCDISAKGVGCLGNTELTPATLIEVWLQIPDQGEPLYTRGQIAWSKEVEPQVWRAGINLEKADLMGLSRVLRA